MLSGPPPPTLVEAETVRLVALGRVVLLSPVKISVEAPVFPWLHDACLVIWLLEVKANPFPGGQELDSPVPTPVKIHDPLPEVVSEAERVLTDAWLFTGVTLPMPFSP